MILESVDIQELKNCQENNSSGYVMFVLPQIIAELEAFRELREAASRYYIMEHYRHVEENIPTPQSLVDLASALARSESK